MGAFNACLDAASGWLVGGGQEGQGNLLFAIQDQSIKC